MHFICHDEVLGLYAVMYKFNDVLHSVLGGKCIDAKQEITDFVKSDEGSLGLRTILCHVNRSYGLCVLLLVVKCCRNALD